MIFCTARAPCKQGGQVGETTTSKRSLALRRLKCTFNDAMELANETTWVFICRNRNPVLFGKRWQRTLYHTDHVRSRPQNENTFQLCQPPVPESRVRGVVGGCVFGVRTFSLSPPHLAFWGFIPMECLPSTSESSLDLVAQV
jgi:hypothetical protein